MIDRCNNRNLRCFKNYGGRGIAVCDAWRASFDAFLADMGPRPPGHTLDRIDNERGYGPDNCQWATVRTQNRNRRSGKMSEFDVRELLRLVHEEGTEVHTLDLVFPISLQQARNIALGKYYRLDGYAYPPRLPRRSDAKQFRGGKAPKLSPDDVRAIRAGYAAGDDVKLIAARYGISKPNAYNVATGRTWRSVN